MSERQVEVEHRVTPLELFLDLVFVFAFTQVTTCRESIPASTGSRRLPSAAARRCTCSLT